VVSRQLLSARNKLISWIILALYVTSVLEKPCISPKSSSQTHKKSFISQCCFSPLYNVFCLLFGPLQNLHTCVQDNVKSSVLKHAVHLLYVVWPWEQLLVASQQLMGTQINKYCFFWGAALRRTAPQFEACCCTVCWYEDKQGKMVKICGKICTTCVWPGWQRRLTKSAWIHLTQTLSWSQIQLS